MMNWSKIVCITCLFVILSISGVIAASYELDVLATDLTSSQADVRQAALVRAAELGMEGIALIPQLVFLLNDPVYDIHWRASRVLDQMGPDTIPHLKDVLQSEASTARAKVSALRLLGKYGGEQEIRILLTALKDTDAEVKSAAIAALVQIEDVTNTVAVINSLQEILKNDYNSDVRKNAVDAITKLDLVAEETVVAFAHALSDSALPVMLAGMRGLRSKGDLLFPLVMEMVQSESEEYQWASAVVLEKDLTRAKEAMPYLTKLINIDSSHRVVWASLSTLAALGDQDVKELSNHEGLEQFIQGIGRQMEIKEMDIVSLKKTVEDALAKSDLAYEGIPSLENPGQWRLVFEDDFTGDTLDTSKWNYNYPWGPTHNHRAYMDPNNVELNDGVLRIRADNRRHPDSPEFVEHDGTHSMDYTAGAITSHGKFHFTYGYIEASIKVPSTKGFWPAFWLLSDGWPPEVDIMEILTRDPRELHINYHYGPSYANKWSHYQKFTVDDLSQDFYVYGFKWTPTEMSWYLNGEQIGTAFTNQEWIAQSRNMYILINLAIGGWGGDPDETTEWPSYYEVDWVRVWQTGQEGS